MRVRCWLLPSALLCWVDRWSTPGRADSTAMGLMPASYKGTARSVSRVLGDGRRQSDRSLKGHEAGVRKGQPWAVNHHPGIVAGYGLPPRGNSRLASPPNPSGRSRHLSSRRLRMPTSDMRSAKWRPPCPRRVRLAGDRLSCVIGTPPGAHGEVGVPEFGANDIVLCMQKRDLERAIREGWAVKVTLFMT